MMPRLPRTSHEGHGRIQVWPLKLGGIIITRGFGIIRKFTSGEVVVGGGEAKINRVVVKRKLGAGASKKQKEVVKRKQGEGAHGQQNAGVNNLNLC